MNQTGLSICLSVLAAFQTIGIAAARTEATSVHPVNVQINATSASIGNPSLSWNLALIEKHVGTTVLINHRTGKASRIEGEDFVLELGDGRKIGSSAFTLEQALDESIPGGGRRLVFHLVYNGLHAQLVTQLMPGEWWATRWLEISSDGGELAAVTFGQWRCADAQGPNPGEKDGVSPDHSLGLSVDRGQPVYCADLFLAIAHPGAQNVVSGDSISCRLPSYETLSIEKSARTREFIVGAGEGGGARHAFLKYIDATRANPARMICLVNDWYWKDKSRTIEALQALARVKQATGIPIDSLTLDDGWDSDWDAATGLWGRLGSKRFPGGWESLQAAGRPADIAVSLWFGPIGGYSTRKERVDFGRSLGFETYGDKLCLAGPRYHHHVTAAFAQWARLGMDYIKVDGFWPECPKTDHGHLVGERGTIQQMDSLMDVFSSWREGRPNVVIGYTSGSNPSAFWLQHCDFVWRGGADDAYAGVGESFDRYSTFVDCCLQRQRAAGLPASAFVTFDMVQDRIKDCSDLAFERNAWWLAARTSLHHDWYVQAGDLTTDRWQLLTRAIGWAKVHEKEFRFSHMVGGDVRRGEIYGFAAYDAGRGTLALRNPSDVPRTLETTLSDLLDLSAADRSRRFTLCGGYGAIKPLEGERAADARWEIDLPPLGIAVFEVRKATTKGEPEAPRQEGPP